MSAPSHADAMLFMEYYKLWDTPLDGEAWALFRTLSSEGVLEDFERFSERVPSSSRDYVLFDRVCCSFEQAGVLMKNGLMHPDLYFDAWASPARAWERARVAIEGLRTERGSDDLYANFEWLAGRGEQWRAAREDAD
jgi:hypothetical protein